MLWYQFWAGHGRSGELIDVVPGEISADSSTVRFDWNGEKVVLMCGPGTKHVSWQHRDFLVRNLPGYNVETDDIVPIAATPVDDEAIDLGF